MSKELIINVFGGLIVLIIARFRRAVTRYLLKIIRLLYENLLLVVCKLKNNFPLYIRRIGKKTIVLKIKKLGLSFDWYLINEEDDTILFKGAKYSKEECKIEAYSKIKPLRVLKETHEKLSDTREVWFTYFK